MALESLSATNPLNITESFLFLLLSISTMSSRIQSLRLPAETSDKWEGGTGRGTQLIKAVSKLSNKRTQGPHHHSQLSNCSTPRALARPRRFNPVESTNKLYAITTSFMNGLDHPTRYAHTQRTGMVPGPLPVTSWAVISGHQVTATTDLQNI